MATAIGMRSLGVARSTRASEVGVTPAAPIACTTLARMSNSGFGASAQTAEAIVNSPSAPRKRRLRPSRSASRPAGTSAAANTSV